MRFLYTTAIAMYTIAAGDCVTAWGILELGPNFLGKFFACVNNELPRSLTALAVNAGDIPVSSHPSLDELSAGLVN